MRGKRRDKKERRKKKEERRVKYPLLNPIPRGERKMPSPMKR